VRRIDDLECHLYNQFQNSMNIKPNGLTLLMGKIRKSIKDMKAFLKANEKSLMITIVNLRYWKHIKCIWMGSMVPSIDTSL
jgi:hypothetical protein